MNKGCGSAFCHGAGQGNLMMNDQDAAYMNLVMQPAAGPACGTSGKLRVVLNMFGRPVPTELSFHQVEKLT